MKIPRSTRTYQVLSLVAHLAFLGYTWLFGFWYILIGSVFGLVIYNLSAQLFMHRAVAHKQFNFSESVNRVFCALFSMLNFGSLALNCAIHVQHHAYSDTSRDPHNFREIGIFRTLLKEWDKKIVPPSKFYMGYLRNKDFKFQHNNNANYALLASVLCPYLPVVSFWLINLLYIVVHLGPEGDPQLNLNFLYPLMWGEEQHRDHHLNPSKKKMHNFDLIYYVGRTLEGT
jgi:fatty-acid desaturase